MTAKFPFKLGARVLRLLYDNFLLQDFSLQNFARGLQVKCAVNNRSIKFCYYYLFFV